MKFLSEIKKLRANPDSNLLEHMEYSILKIPTKTKTGISYQFFAFKQDSDSLIGEGGYGSVYKAFPIDAKTGKLQEKAYAVKKIAQKHYEASEFNLFKRYYKVYPPAFTDSDVYIVSELFPGVDLFDRDSNLHPSLTTLSFQQTLKLIVELCIALNLFHHDTYSTGDAISHSDIKGQNIRVYFDPLTGRIYANIFDFGMAKEIEDNPDHLIAHGSGTPLYFPPELIKLSRGIKSDIYAFVPIIISLLGGMPFEDKFPHLKKMDFAALAAAPYTYTNMLLKYEAEIKAFKLPLRNIIITFLDRMQAEYSKRPSSDEMLKFFIVLSNCYRLITSLADKYLLDDVKREGLESQLYTHKALLILLCTGLWNSLLVQSKHRIINQEFLDDPTFCKELIGIFSYNSGKLSALEFEYTKGLTMKRSELSFLSPSSSERTPERTVFFATPKSSIKSPYSTEEDSSKYQP